MEGGKWFTFMELRGGHTDTPCEWTTLSSPEGTKYLWGIGSKGMMLLKRQWNTVIWRDGVKQQEGKRWSVRDLPLK